MSQYDSNLQPLDFDLGHRVYKAQEGDTVSKIAQELLMKEVYGVESVNPTMLDATKQLIMLQNNLSSDGAVANGQELFIPAVINGVDGFEHAQYTVQPGDSLMTIAGKLVWQMNANKDIQPSLDPDSTWQKEVKSVAYLIQRNNVDQFPSLTENQTVQDGWTLKIPEILISGDGKKQPERKPKEPPIWGGDPPRAKPPKEPPIWGGDPPRAEPPPPKPPCPEPPAPVPPRPEPPPVKPPCPEPPPPVPPRPEPPPVKPPCPEPPPPVPPRPEPPPVKPPCPEPPPPVPPGPEPPPVKPPCHDPPQPEPGSGKHHRHEKDH